MGGTNGHQETFMPHLGVLQQMPNITVERVGNVIEDEIWFSACLRLSCRVLQVQTVETFPFFFFLKVGGDHARILHCAASSLAITTKTGVQASADGSDSFKEQHPATSCAIRFISPVQPVVDMHPQV